ncbi:TonB-dependent siderophore receptor [Azoarcus indigens]|uniref:Iron complex outermembrane receptor protein n=1 Tax=Azoarcus indigens TaxID=29545 RepID=A0A4R6DF46_9RHOO|nr:TonB-dependent receptor [Azoarcus indigens]NMG67895.1 TonB-dependent siderophore receptor [Azoarcus indigens]TDN43080.1 iron complex outermembrane receptor protein [Azoarcus indigens]
MHSADPLFLPFVRALKPTVRALLLAALAAGVGAPLPVAAQAAAVRHAFAVPAGPLDQAVVRFGRQAGVQFSVSGELTAGRSSVGVSGSYTVAEALARLLAGTGLEAVEANGEYTLRPAPARGEATLATVQVSAAEIRESAYGPVEGYRAERSGTATKTDTALRETPMAIQVVPQQVIKEQQATRLADVVQNVSSVRPGSTFGNRTDSYIVRGFQSSLVAWDGFISNQLFGNPGFVDMANIERIEVLKGPASMLYGLGDPGGLLNIVTKRPMREARYDLAFQAGSNEFQRVEADFNQPLNADGSLALRFNGASQNWGSDRDFLRRSHRDYAAPVLGWQIDDATRLVVEYEYMNQSQPFDRGLVASGDGVVGVSNRSYFGEKWSRFSLSGEQTRYVLEHKLDATWLLRHTGRYQESESHRLSADSRGLQANGRILNRRATDGRDDSRQWTAQFDAIGDFTDAYIGHKLLFGFEAGRAEKNTRVATAALAALDVFTPVRGAMPGVFGTPTVSEQEIIHRALYLQDQVWLGERWKLLLGLRYDDAEQNATTDGTRVSVSDGKLSPRFGVMYDLTDWAALYASYARSFKPVAEAAFDGSVFKPEMGKQGEVGVKFDLFERRLGLTFAAYELKRRNVTTADPVNTGFSVQTGEQRSRGLELDAVGELGGGWRVLASAAYTDAEITKDNTYAAGNRLPGVPLRSGSVWLKRQVEHGDWRGLGFGVGVFAAGERQGDLGNTFKVAGYARTDVSLSYQRDDWKLTVGVKNLFDRDYIEAPVSRTEIYPGASRTVLATLDIRL